MSGNDRFPVSVIILTLNEASNIETCIRYLDWADEIILVDSNSSDNTVERATAARSNVRVVRNRFEDFGQQRNWALDHGGAKHDWILFVDADERITPRCAAAIRDAVQNAGEHVGFFLCYRNIFLGKWIRHCTMFPSWQLRLLRRGRVRYLKEGHGQREDMDGTSGYIREPYDHLDLSKGLSEWIARHNVYSTQEAGLLRRLREEPLKLGDCFGDAMERRRCLKRLAARLGAGPVTWFVYLYLVRLGFMDGRAGYYYCMLKAAHQSHIKAKLIGEAG